MNAETMLDLHGERFWSKVDFSGNCWLWTATLVNAGYGQFHVSGKNFRPHRLVYEAFVGPIPEGLVIDHLCRNRACVNPAHMEPVTNRENLMRGLSPSAIAARRTHCLRGHEYDSTDGRGYRYCLTCNRAKCARQARSKRVTT